MTNTTCDFCGCEMEKVEEGIFYDCPLKNRDNPGRLEITRLNGRGYQMYDICPECIERLDIMIDALKNWTPEADQWLENYQKYRRKHKHHTLKE